MIAKNRKLNLQVEWKKACETLQAAEALLQQHFFPDAVARSYYAAFHAATALLLTEGLEANSHQALGRLFSLHFVKSGKLDTRYSRILSMAQKYREEADYTSEYVFTQTDAEACVNDVKSLLAATEALLRRGHFFES